MLGVTGRFHLNMPTLLYEMRWEEMRDKSGGDLEGEVRVGGRGI